MADDASKPDRGQPIERSDAELDRASVIDESDKSKGRQTWIRYATPNLRPLIDADRDPSTPEGS